MSSQLDLNFIKPKSLETVRIKKVLKFKTQIMKRKRIKLLVFSCINSDKGVTKGILVKRVSGKFNQFEQI